MWQCGLKISVSINLALIQEKGVSLHEAEKEELKGVKLLSRAILCCKRLCLPLSDVVLLPDCKRIRGEMTLVIS